MALPAADLMGAAQVVAIVLDEVVKSWREFFSRRGSS
jgi:hypothetical protein